MSEANCLAELAAFIDFDFKSGGTSIQQSTGVAHHLGWKQKHQYSYNNQPELAYQLGGIRKQISLLYAELYNKLLGVEVQ